ncbi:MAG: minichromosome maintenance protein MCM [Candidatus Micrarchaeota archaeon]|nr:minichromosome maintenance protein MCM [Candidatus Micrarchaeota archaeon]
MEKLDLTPLISSFNEFFTSIYKKHIDGLLLVYPKKRSIFIDYSDLERFDPDLADKLMKEPDLVIAAAEESIKLMNFSLASGGIFAPHIRFHNFPGTDILIEQLGAKDLNELVSFKGVITKRAETMHKVKIAVFKCDVCDSTMREIVTKNFIPPKKCETCKKFALKQMDEESKFTDIQKAEAQELLERVRGSAPAAHIELLMEDDFINTISPGDNVEVVGVLRLKQPIKTKQKQEMLYGRFLDVVYVKSLKKDFEEIEIDKEEEKRILEFSRDSNIEQILVDSIAPGIYGHQEVKRALILQLFGGTRGKTMPGGLPIRDDIHVLLIGDPGLAKSRFLHSVSDIAPKSIFVSGKSTSGVGLTVSAEKDELGEGGWTLKAGALVLASGGTAQLDEFDKIEEEDRSALHEVMESQQISIAKAGMVATFKTKTAILAAANPKYGRFDQNKNLGDQFDVPPTLLSRFDLIFPIVDVLDEEKDLKLAQQILAAHKGDAPREDKRLVEKDFLRKYIAYARRNIRPLLTNEAVDKIKDFYVDLRRRSKDAGAIAITPRYLEGLVRLAEANAKIRLNPLVEQRDAEMAVSLMNHVMKQIMTDKATGVLDVDVVATGKPKSEREKLQKVDTIIDIIKDLLRNNDSAELDKIIQMAISSGIDEQTTRRILTELLRKGEIYEKEHGHVKLVGEK